MSLFVYLMSEFVPRDCILRTYIKKQSETKFAHKLSFFRILDFIDGVRLRLWTDATNGHVVHPPDDTWVCRTTVEWYWQDKPKNSEKNLSQCLFSTINPIWIDPGANPGLRGERPAANCLSHGTTKLSIMRFLIKKQVEHITQHISCDV
jgi:hypothetical protein